MLQYTKEEIERKILDLRQQYPFKSNLIALKGDNSIVGETHFIAGFNCIDEIRHALEISTKLKSDDEECSVYVLQSSTSSSFFGRWEDLRTFGLDDFREIPDLDMSRYIDTSSAFLSEKEISDLDATIADISAKLKQAEEKYETVDFRDRINLKFSQDYRDFYNNEISDEEKCRFRNGDTYFRIAAKPIPNAPYSPLNFNGYLIPFERVSSERLEKSEFIYAIGFDSHDEMYIY